MHRRVQGDYSQTFDPLGHLKLGGKVAGATLGKRQLPQVIVHAVPQFIKQLLIFHTCLVFVP